MEIKIIKQELRNRNKQKRETEDQVEIDLENKQKKKTGNQVEIDFKQIENQLEDDRPRKGDVRKSRRRGRKKIEKGNWKN